MNSRVVREKIGAVACMVLFVAFFLLGVLLIRSAGLEGFFYTMGALACFAAAIFFCWHFNDGNEGKP